MVGAAVTGAPAPSPCIGTCRLDTRQICVGCRRTLAEIAEWSQASEARRHEILRALPARRVDG
jgi:predicted Fe-S protein YdhL (DUF1289 family)